VNRVSDERISANKSTKEQANLLKKDAALNVQNISPNHQ
jgi:hypothetical protein